MNRRSPQGGIIGRRAFLAGSLALPIAGCARLRSGPDALDAGNFPSYTEGETGAQVWNLTPDAHRNTVVYQTHPQWTAEMGLFLFQSDRSGDGMRPHALFLDDGTVSPVTPGACGTYALTQRSGMLYFISDLEVMRVSLRDAFAGARTGERVGVLPDYVQSVAGGMSVDADDRMVVFGFHRGDGQWGVAAMDAASGETRVLALADFQVGHIQTNPWRSGEILFCHETGGDAPQRMWYMNADGGGIRPFYDEYYEEWVTHECWWGPGRAIFTIWPYDEEHTSMPHGVAIAHLGAAKPEILAQYPAWHTQGSPDGQWAMGDDFERNLWLIDPRLRERRLLVRGRLGGGLKVHPHASFTPDSRHIVFNTSRNGTEQIHLVRLPKWGDLPPP